VSGSGPSLTESVAAAVAHQHVIAVNDSYKLLPGASIVYASDFRWWLLNHDLVARNFAARRCTCAAAVNSAADVAELKSWGVEVLPIAHGQTSLYAAVQLALILGHTTIALIGADFRWVDGRSHFFGDHVELRNTTDFTPLLSDFYTFAKRMPVGVTIWNCTEHSALKAFPFKPIEECINARPTRPAP
jgi:hypothetical protein